MFTLLPWPAQHLAVVLQCKMHTKERRHFVMLSVPFCCCYLVIGTKRIEYIQHRSRHCCIEVNNSESLSGSREFSSDETV